MSRLLVRVYHGYSNLGEAKIEYQGQDFRFHKDEIRIHHVSAASNPKFPHLAILKTIGSSALRCKFEASSPDNHQDLLELHRVCDSEFRTAVVLVGNDVEVHLVAMRSRNHNFPCFWVFSVASGVYESCLKMLMNRCLAIVFDLDETLVSAKSTSLFTKQIKNLEASILKETDPTKKLALTMELERNQGGMSLLQQCIANDTVVVNGETYTAELEEVRPTSDGQQIFHRPVIRCGEMDMIFTRINPQVRATSMLVRIRPDWDQLRRSLTGVARRNFEVYVCTKSERDYAREIWRLLDPEAHLISLKQQEDRIVSVATNIKKSLKMVFKGGICHPKISMIVDDRIDVWEERDVPRIYSIVPYNPYSAQAVFYDSPLLQTSQLATNFRTYIFKQFDSYVRTRGVCYEDGEDTLPPSPSVNYINAL